VIEKGRLIAEKSGNPVLLVRASADLAPDTAEQAAIVALASD